ncbi:hypothetical protein AN416_38465 (plasmid) [Paraburkholderia caribensis]|nr:hypothetical protein AN416_38465 [Paraburkholderia caribensis]
MQVSRSGYYAHRRTKPGAKPHREQFHVKAALAASGATYGNRQVMHALRRQALRIGRYRVRALMREAGPHEIEAQVRLDNRQQTYFTGG